MPVTRRYGRTRLATNIQTISLASDPAEQTSWSSDTYTISLASLRALGNVKYFIVSWMHVSAGTVVQVKLNGVVQGSVTGTATYPDSLMYVTFPIVEPNLAQTILIETTSGTTTIKRIQIEGVVVTVI